jgi:hypothetical protein
MLLLQIPRPEIAADKRKKFERGGSNARTDRLAGFRLYLVRCRQSAFVPRPW